MHERKVAQVVILILGSACLWMCLKSPAVMLAQQIQTSFFDEPPTALAWYGIYMLALIAVTVLMVRYSLLFSPRIGPVRTVTLAIAGVSGCVGLALLTWYDTLVSLAFGLILSALFVTVFINVWIGALHNYPVARIPFYLALSYTVSEFIRWLFSLADIGWLRVIFPLIALVFALLLVVPRRDPQGPPDRSLGSMPWGIIAAGGVLLALWSIVLAFLPNGNAANLTAADLVWTYGITAVILAAMAVFFGWASRKKRDGSGQSHFSKKMFLYPFSVIVIAYMVILALMLVLSVDNFTVFKRVLIAVAQCLEVFTLILVAYHMMDRHLAQPIILCIYVALLNTGPWMVVSNVIGAMGGTSLGDLSVNQPVVVGLSLVTAVVLVIFLLAHASSPEPATAAATSEEDAHRELCEQAAEGHGLSSKELEVMALLYRGYSAGQIAEVLYISPNTVRSHTNTVYKKLGVHSKRELMELVDKQR